MHESIKASAWGNDPYALMELMVLKFDPNMGRRIPFAVYRM